MAIGTCINPSHSLPPLPIELQQLRRATGERYFDEQSFFAQDSKVAQLRARAFFQHFERNLSTQHRSKSPLQALLERTIQLSDSGGNKLLSSVITPAFFKQGGYLSRLFSDESWEEWMENRTSLGKVASQFRDCIGSSTEVSSFTERLNESVTPQASEEADALLRRLEHRDVMNITPFKPNHCLTGFFGGTVASLLIKNPLPLLIGLSECFPWAQAQQKVGNEFLVNTYTLGSQLVPSVASFDNGNFVVTWQSSGYGVFGQLFNETGPKIGNEFQVNTYTYSGQGSSSVASFGNGSFVVTWQSFQQDGSLAGVYGQLFNPLGSMIGSEFQVNTYTFQGQGDPCVTNLTNNNFVVTWESYPHLLDNSDSGVYGQLYDGSGNNIGSEFQINTYIDRTQAYPSSASFGNGNFVVVWESWYQDGSQQGVYGQLFDENGVKIGSEFRVNTYTNNAQTDPSVASLTNGNFVVTWNSNLQDGSSWGVYAQLFNGIGAKVGNEFRVNTYATSAQMSPSITSFPNNTFVVTWHSQNQDSSNYGIFAQLFDENARKLGNEFQVNTYSNNSQSRPSITALRNGNFVVTWDSDGQDGNFTGVYGQIFHDNITYPSTSTTTSTTTSSTASTRSSTTSSTTTSSTTSTTSSTTTSSSATSTSRSTTPSSLSKTSNELSSSSSPSKQRLIWLWLLLGIGGGTTCLGITSYLFLKNRRKGKDDDELFAESAEMGQTTPRVKSEYGFVDISQRPSEYANRPDIAKLGSNYANRPQRKGLDPEERETATPSRVKGSLPPKREEKEHTRIGDKYDLMNKISREEAQVLYEQTGIQVQFQEGNFQTKVLLGVGNYGKLRIAYNLVTNRFACVKKIKGDRQIAQSREEATLQSKLERKANIMPIWDFVEAESSQRKPVLYQFMPLAGFGDGEELRNLFDRVTNPKQRKQILTHVAKGLLTGVFNMQQASIYHLDIKPANMVFDMKGELYVIDFGCAKELSDGWIQEKISGDTKYFSPERMELHRQVRKGQKPAPIAANRIDSWAVGLSLLVLATGDYPFDRTSVIERLEKWDNAYFQRKLDEIPLLKNPTPGSLMTVVKELLAVDPEKRLNISGALAQVIAKKPFSSSSEQKAAFTDLKQLVPSPTQHTEQSPPREKNEDYEHVFFQKFEDQSDYIHPPPSRSADSTSDTDPIPRPGASSGPSLPLPDDYF